MELLAQASREAFMDRVHTAEGAYNEGEGDVREQRSTDGGNPTDRCQQGRAQRHRACPSETDTIALKEEALATAQASDDTGYLTLAIEEQVKALRERYNLLVQRNAVKEFDSQMKEMAARSKEFNNAFKSSFEDAFTGFLDGTKSAKDAFRDFGNAVLHEIDRITAKNLAESLFSKSSSSGGDTDWISSAFKYIGGFFADGGNPPVGKASIVGERGPELFVPKTAGTIVPNSALKVGGKTTINNINVTMPQGANRDTGTQFGAAIGASINRALARNT